MRALPLVALLLAGCYSEQRFVEDYDLAFCEKVFECSDESVLPFLPYDDVADCQEYRAGQTDEEHPLGEDCAYDGGEAEDCVIGYEALSCREYEDGEQPTACDQVCASE
ncbi:MAG: hypothetical protein H6740_13990 [Alphaproteobacteria bacterium]|nr:hypothetical protein [Alphaproteobacteria bacterium]